MLSTAAIKQIKSLQQKKFRDRTGLFVVEGNKCVTELLNSDHKVEAVYATEQWQGSDELVRISAKEMQRISGLKNQQQVLAVAHRQASAFDVNAFSGKTTLALDGVNDPGNLGTIIRLADWFGIRNIICSSNTVDRYNPKVVQSTMGSLFRVNMHYAELPVVLQQLKQEVGLPLYAATMSGTQLYEAELENSCVLVMGSESHGVSEEVLALVDGELSIPGKGSAESLNVAMATGIILSESHRRGLSAT